MSHDHLQYDHRMMRRRGMNLMDGKNLDVMNLDGKMMIHHVTHRKKDDLMKVGPKMI